MWPSSTVVMQPFTFEVIQLHHIFICAGHEVPHYLSKATGVLVTFMAYGLSYHIIFMASRANIIFIPAYHTPSGVNHMYIYHLYLRQDIQRIMNLE